MNLATEKYEYLFFSFQTSGTIPIQYIQSFNWNSSRNTLKVLYTNYKETCVTYDTKAYMET
jgi:hypothetical protein